MHITLTIEHDGAEREYSLAAHYVICPMCDGRGTDGGHSVECDGGGFTASEWAEQDEDFRQDYLAGVYDRPCEACRGHAGRVLEVDRDKADPSILALFDAENEAEADYLAMCAAERRMGA